MAKRLSGVAAGLAATGSALLLACGAAEQASPPGTESLVVLTLDTTRADHLGCYGNPLPISPHLDALAARGVLFENAYVPMPQTLPTHATLFTGLEPRLHGALENAYRLPDVIETLAEVFRGAGYRTGGFIGALVLSAQTGIAQGFEHFDHPKQGTDRRVRRVVRRPARAVTDAALAWSETLTPDEPYVLWAHYYDPHHPFSPPPAARQAISRDAVIDWMRTRRRDLRHRRTSRGEVINTWYGYASEIRGMDEEIGRLLAGLEARGLLERTTVVAIGDHGEGLFEHGLKGHGLKLYEEQMRVPLIVARPGGAAAGRRVAAPVQAADLMPTLLELLLGRASERPLSGRSFADALRGGGEPEPRPVYVERPHYSNERLRQRRGRSSRYRWGVMAGVIDDGFKLIREPGEPERLFDLREDPEETRDVSAAQPERAAALRAQLDAWLAAAPVAEPGAAAEVSAEQLEALRALGYIDGGEE